MAVIIKNTTALTIEHLEAAIKSVHQAEANLIFWRRVRCPMAFKQ